METFDHLVAVDAGAPFRLMQAAADRLSDDGRIVNISSGVTSTALAGRALYSGVKAFIDQRRFSSARGWRRGGPVARRPFLR
ncbi:MAG: SDR family NAD(P)-dependent oxidoreductase [Solirubrobacteraceae bacterium]